MKKVIFLLAFFALALALLLIPFGSATMTLSPTSLDFEIMPGDSDSETFTMTYNGTEIPHSGILNWTNPNSEVTLSLNQTSFSMMPGQSLKIKVTVDVDDSADYDTYEAHVYIYASNGTLEATLPVTIEVGRQYCESGNQGDYLDMTIDSPDDGDKIYAGQNVSVKLEIDNNHDDELDIVAEVELYDVDDDDSIADADYETTIGEDDTKTVTLYLKVPSDADTDHDFMINAKVYEDGNEEDQCNEYSIDVEVDKKEHDVKISSLAVSPTTVACGDAFTLSLRISNDGSNDEDAKISIKSSELSMSFEKTLTIDADDEYSTTLNFNVPKNISEKTYTIPVDVYYDYDAGYQSIVRGTVDLKVQGKCEQEEQAQQDVSFSAQVQGDAFPGRESAVKIMLTNTGNTQATYTVSVSGYESWATLSRIEPSTVTLTPGSSGQVLATLVPLSSAYGDNSLKVKVTFGSTTKEQVIFVPVKRESQEASWGNQLAFTLSREWQWILTDIILIAIIIALIVSLVRQRSKYDTFYSEQPTEIKFTNLGDTDYKRGRRR